MSARGAVTVECDVKGCHAEQEVAPDDLLCRGVIEFLEPQGWHYGGAGALRLYWTCPQCIEEGKRA